MDFKECVWMPEHRDVEGVQHQALLCAVEPLQSRADLLAILYQRRGFQFNLLKPPDVYANTKRVSVNIVWKTEVLWLSLERTGSHDWSTILRGRQVFCQ